MVTRPLDTIFCSADRIRDAGAVLFNHIPAEGRLHRSLTGLLAALDQFDAELAGGARKAEPVPPGGPASNAAA